MSAYVSDVCMIAFNIDDEHQTQGMFQLYNKAGGEKINEDKTLIFWISD